MLFKTRSGNLVELNRDDFINDFEYYANILRIKGVKLNTEPKNPDERVLNLLKNVRTEKQRQYIKK